MGSCNSRDHGAPDSQTSAAYLPARRAVEQDRDARRSDGAVENRALHEGAILGIVSAGMGEFVTCGEDKTLRLHNLVAESGSFQNNMSFAGHTKAVARATYGPTTRLIYSCSRDTTIRQWNRSDSTALRVFQGHEMACTALALSADERNLASGSRDASVRTWDVQTGQQRTASAKVPRNLVTCLKYLPDKAGSSASSSSSSSSVVQGGEDLRLRVWDVREAGLRPSVTIEGYTCFPDETIKIYDRESGDIVVDHAEPGCGGYTSLAFQHDPSTGLPVLFASTVTGGLYAFRLEATTWGTAGTGAGVGAGVAGGAEEGWWRLRCVAFVPGTAIV
eukprot:g14219.t1